MNEYDVVVIGSGLGGLQTAYILSKEGYNVCVLEQGSVYGGSIQNFARDGVVFDTGAHYVGALDNGQSLHRYFEYFDLNSKLKLKRMDKDLFDQITFGDDTKTYSHAIGFDNFSEKLISDFPNEKQAILNYTRELKIMGESFPMFNLGKNIKYSDVGKYTNQGISNYLESQTSNKRLLNVLAGSNLLYAGEKNKTPLYIHGLISNSYIQSSYRFEGGSGQMANFLIKSIRSLGGTVLKNKKVVKLNMTGKKISNATTSDGDIFYADSFISNVHPTPTFKMLPKEVTKKVYFKRVSGLENTLSVFSLYITFKSNSFKYLNHNVYHHKNNSVWVEPNYKTEDWPKNFLFLTQVPKNGSTYAEGATVMAFMNYSEFSDWEGTEIENRPESYNILKKLKEEKLLDLVEERFPGIRNSIKSVYSSTPLTYKDYTKTHEGSIYGISRDYNSQTKSTILPNTKIPNLFLTGQNTNLHGVMGVTVGAVQTASKFVGVDYLLNKIKSI